MAVGCLSEASSASSKTSTHWPWSGGICFVSVGADTDWMACKAGDMGLSEIDTASAGPFLPLILPLRSPFLSLKLFRKDAPDRESS